MVLWHFLYVFEYVHDISKPTFIMWNVSDVWRIIEKGLTIRLVISAHSDMPSTVMLWGSQQWQTEDDLAWMFHKLFGLHRSNRLIWLGMLNVGLGRVLSVDLTPVIKNYLHRHSFTFRAGGHRICIIHGIPVHNTKMCVYKDILTHKHINIM